MDINQLNIQLVLLKAIASLDLGSESRLVSDHQACFLSVTILRKMLSYQLDLWSRFHYFCPKHIKWHSAEDAGFWSVQLDFNWTDNPADFVHQSQCT